MIQYAGERKKTRRPAPTPGSWSARATTCASWEPASVSSGYIFQLERIYFSIRADIFFNISDIRFFSTQSDVFPCDPNLVLSWKKQISRSFIGVLYSRNHYFWRTGAVKNCKIDREGHPWLFSDFLVILRLGASPASVDSRPF